MKLFIDKREFEGAINVVRSITSRNYMPALSHILMQADEGKLRLTTSNQDITLKANINVDIEDEGSMCVPANSLSKLISSLENGNLELSSKDSRLSVKQGEGRFSLAGIKASDYPDVEIMGGNDNYIEM